MPKTVRCRHGVFQKRHYDFGGWHDTYAEIKTVHCANPRRTFFVWKGFGCICEINEDATALWGLFWDIADATRGIPHPDEIIRELDAVFRNAGKER